MHPRHRKAIREGLARAKHVVVADRRYAFVIREFCEIGKADLFVGVILEAEIERTLHQLVAEAAQDNERGHAIAHAQERSQTFLRWVRRHPERVVKIIAEAANP